MVKNKKKISNKKFLSAIEKRREKYQNKDILNKSFDEKFKFRGSFFSNPNFKNCKFNGSSFLGGDCERLEFKKCTFNNCTFEGGDYIESRFIDCTLKNCSILRGNYHKANFQGSIIINTEIRMVNLRKTNFTDTMIKNCILAGNSGWSNFSRSSLEDDDFSNLTMKYSLVVETHIKGCIFNVTDIPYLITPTIEVLKKNSFIYEKNIIPTSILFDFLYIFLQDSLRINDYNIAANIVLILGEIQSAFKILFRGFDYYLDNDLINDFYNGIKIYSISFNKYFPEFSIETIYQLVQIKKEFSDVNYLLSNEKQFLEVLEYFQLFNISIDLKKCALTNYIPNNKPTISFTLDEKPTFSEIFYLITPFFNYKFEEKMDDETMFEIILNTGSIELIFKDIVLPILPALITLTSCIIKLIIDQRKKKNVTPVNNNIKNIFIITNNNQKLQMNQINDNRMIVLNKIIKVTKNENNNITILYSK
ncbi:MAG: pentapeptide repeat-containing protein [Candidatus Nanoarchaeia archaeon]|nr:pentapeptide repeat-containing protein [Candidatus Nanoarchaeia archaeon]